MNRLAARALLHLLLAIACLMALALFIFRGLLAELADDVIASENEHRTNNRRGNAMSKENRKLTDAVSQQRAANARLAAVLGDTTRAQALLADATYYAGNAALPIRRAS